LCHQKKHSHSFYHHISKDIFHLLNDFRILFSDCYFECNRIFASLISNKIFTHAVKFPKDDFIDFSNSLDPEVAKKFFKITRGKSIWMNEFNREQILDTTNILEFNSLSLLEMETNTPFTFIANDISSLNFIQNDSIQKIISSYFLHLKNESQLFEFLKNLIKESPECLSLLKYLHLGLIDFPNFAYYINSIQFHEFNSYLFDHMKYFFFYNYLLLAERNTSQKDIQTLLSLSESIASYSKIYEENQDLKIPITFYSRNFDHFEIIPSEDNQICFTKEQQKIIGKSPNSFFQWNNQFFPRNKCF
jgi:hypothetical protein